MTNKILNQGIFNGEYQFLKGKNLILKITILGAVIFLAMFIAPIFVQGQRLCEHNDNPVATIKPCVGAVGATISIKPGRRLSSALGRLVFKRVLANGVPAQVITQISNGTATIPPQLCTAGNGRWEVWLVLANNQSQGKIGAFTTGGCVVTSIPKPAPGPTVNSPTPKTVILPPIVMNVDNEVYARTQNISQSYLKNIVSSVPEIATGTEWGTNEVKIYGKKPGVTIISFLDENTGTSYQVKVIVKGKPKPFQGGDGQGSIDPCLVGNWESLDVKFLKDDFGPWSGGGGITITFKKDGTVNADYTRMEPLSEPKGSSFVYTGTASGRISTQNHVVTIQSMQVKGITKSLGSVIPLGRLPALGPGVPGGTVNDNGYVCSGNSLEYKSSDVLNTPPIFAVRLKRLK